MNQRQEDKRPRRSIREKLDINKLLDMPGDVTLQRDEGTSRVTSRKVNSDLLQGIRTSRPKVSKMSDLEIKQLAGKDDHQVVQAHQKNRKSSKTTREKVEVYQIQILEEAQPRRSATMRRSTKSSRNISQTFKKAARQTVQQVRYNYRLKRSLQQKDTKQPPRFYKTVHISRLVPCNPQECSAIEQRRKFLEQFLLNQQDPQWISFPAEYHRPLFKSLSSTTISACRVKQTRKPEMPFKLTNTLPFVDSTFPHNDNSLGCRNSSVRWVRPKRAAMSAGTGGLAGRAIYGVLSVLRSFGLQSLNLLLEGQKYNQKGWYFVRLYLNGVWRYVQVDSVFPTDKLGHYRPTCSKGPEFQLWPVLIEKAYVKSFSTYRQYMDFPADISDVLNELTGAPTESFDSKRQWKKVNELAGSQLVCAVFSSKQGEVAPEYVYRVLSSDQQRIVVLTPGGRQEMSHPSVQQLVGVHTLLEAHHSTIQIMHRSEFYSIIKLTVNEGATGFIEIVQPDKRLAGSKYQYSRGRLISGHMPKRSYEIQPMKRNSWPVRPGSYTFCILMQWSEGRETDLQVSYYGSCKPAYFKRQFYRSAPNTILEAYQQELRACKFAGRKGCTFSEGYFPDPDNNLVLMSIRNDHKEDELVERNIQKVDPELRLLNIRDETDFEMLSKSLHLVVGDMKTKMWEQPVWKMLLNPGEVKTLVFYHPTKKVTPNSPKEFGFLE